MYVSDSSGANSGWQTKGSWTVGGGSQPPTVVSVYPNGGTGLSQVFTATYSDISGYTEIGTALLLVQTSVNGVAACWVQYSVPGNGLYLVNDAGTQAQGPIMPGSSATLQNSQCTLSGSTSSTSGSGNIRTVNFGLTFSAAFAGTKNTYLEVVDLSSNSSGWQWEGSWTVSGSSAQEISPPSSLQVNIGYVPLDNYDYAHSTSSADQGLAVACPSATSIRACYQNAFTNFRAQGVTGIRFFFGVCGGFQSTPLTGCGGNYTQVGGPNSTWTQNLQNFFYDIYAARIYNVTPTMAHGEAIGVGGGAPGQYLPPNPAPVGQTCANTPSMVQYLPAEPYGRVPCTNSPPYSCPTGVDCSSYCQNNAGYPIDDGQHGYNCSPSNPIFVGWQNLNNLANVVIQTASNTPYQGSRGLNIFEFDIEQELNPLQFPVQARFMVDNANTQTGGDPDSVNSIRSSMSSAGYDPSHVAWSAADDQPTVEGDNCYDVYGDYARMANLDSIASAIANGWIGTPGFSGSPDPSGGGLFCGGTAPDNMCYQCLPSGHSLPNIVDLHSYPCLHGSNGCYSNDAQANIQNEAQTDFSDVTRFLQLVSITSPLLVIGETHSNSNNGSGETCELHAPLDAPALTVAGFNLSTEAGQTVVFRPWIDLPDSSACFSPSNQLVNANNQGPYKPSQQ